MPRFSSAFKRRSTADNVDNAAVTGPSFRVLERTEVTGGKSFDGGVRLAAKAQAQPMHRHQGSDATLDDNIFADLKSNRGSGSSNTTKTNSTDTSSRHSNASTTPSSADLGGQEEARSANKKIHPDIPVPPIPKASSNGFLKAAGRTFSFGGQKKHLPPAPVGEDSPSPSPPPPPVPDVTKTPVQTRARATTTSTATTLTPPRVDADFDLDLGGDFSKLMLFGNEKRASVITVKEEQTSRQSAAPRSLTASRQNQPAPIQIDMTTKVEPSPYSWSSQHSDDQLIAPISPPVPTLAKDNLPPPVPRHGSPLVSKTPRPSPSPEASVKKPLLPPQEGTEDDDKLFKDSLSAMSKFMNATSPSTGSPSTRYRRKDQDAKDDDYDDDNLFGSSQTYPHKMAARLAARKQSPPPSNKVMTPSEFEKYRRDKERQEREQSSLAHGTKEKKDDQDEDDDEDNYEDFDDDADKVKQQARQRKRQEAHMSVYRQQMMKVTGETTSMHSHSPRPSLQISHSTPNLTQIGSAPGHSPNTAENSNSDEDEEIPLAILAAHGFPNKARPPTRLSSMMSNPNLRASQQPSYQRPVSTVGPMGGDMPTPTPSSNSRLPAFARNLPQDPFLGAGLVRNPVRESLALGGGLPNSAAVAAGAVPPGGLVGVIANEERNRALRRGSPQVDGSGAIPGSVGYDPLAAVPSHLMYPQPPQQPPPLTPGDQASIQLNHQMAQFMQVQMQIMQMMAATQNGGQNAMMMGQNPMMGQNAFMNQNAMMMNPNAMMGQAGMMGQNGANGPLMMNPLASQSAGNLSVMGGTAQQRPTSTMLGPGSRPGSGAMLGGAGFDVRRSFMGNDSMLDLNLPFSARGDAQLRTMSMVQPSSASWVQPVPNAGFAPSIRIQGDGYAPSIAPSERSNVGLPGRYRPVSQAPLPNLTRPGSLTKSATMSGAIPTYTSQAQPTISVTKSANASDDDDEEGWEAMKAKREKKKVSSAWKTKKSLTSSLSSFL